MQRKTNLNICPVPGKSEIRKRGCNRHFLTIQEGCDKFCTFCVVPYTRGRGAVACGQPDFLRKPGALLRQAVREITLVGPERECLAWVGPGRQRMGVWVIFYSNWPNCPGLDRLRYTTSHPIDMSDDDGDRLFGSPSRS